MLVHQHHAKYDNWCPLHDFECQNIKNGRFKNRPSYNGQRLNHETDPAILFEAVSSGCLMVSIFARISIIRRLRCLESVHNYDSTNEMDIKFKEQATTCRDELYQFLKKHIFYFLNNSSIRIMVSILDALSEAPPTYDTALMCSTFLKIERMSRMISDSKKSLSITRPGVIAGFDRTTTAPDTILNHLYRMRAALFKYPILWLIFYKIVTNDAESQDHIFKRYDSLKCYEIFNFEKVSVANWMNDLLRPSTVDLKYLHLYRKKHETPYGRSRFFPEIDKQFILNNGCKEILDFGCGMGNLNDDQFIWYKYDPCVRRFHDPPNWDRSCLVSYDVLEHIPENELSIIAEWIDILSTKCVVLGISTEPAGGKRRMLDNGENSHCTVRTPEWWVEWAMRMYPNYNVVRAADENRNQQYVTLHITK